ncbi:hypothetical protein HDK77DRAFT_450312 [Phyllosticta capitalensis]
MTVQPSHKRTVLFRIGRVIQTKIFKPGQEKEETVFGVIVSSNSTESRCLLIESYSMFGTCHSHKTGYPHGKHSMIYTTRDPTSPLYGETMLHAPVYASKMRYQHDLPRTARLNYKYSFLVKHDSAVFALASVEGYELKTLHQNYERITGEKLGLRIGRPEVPQMPPGWSALFSKEVRVVEQEGGGSDEMVARPRDGDEDGYDG